MEFSQQLSDCLAVHAHGEPEFVQDLENYLSEGSEEFWTSLVAIAKNLAPCHPARLASGAGLKHGDKGPLSIRLRRSLIRLSSDEEFGRWVGLHDVGDPHFPEWLIEVIDGDERQNAEAAIAIFADNILNGEVTGVGAWILSKKPYVWLDWLRRQLENSDRHHPYRKRLLFQFLLVNRPDQLKPHLEEILSWKYPGLMPIDLYICGCEEAKAEVVAMVDGIDQIDERFRFLAFLHIRDPLGYHDRTRAAALDSVQEWSGYYDAVRWLVEYEPEVAIKLFIEKLSETKSEIHWGHPNVWGNIASYAFQEMGFPKAKPILDALEASANCHLIFRGAEGAIDAGVLAPDAQVTRMIRWLLGADRNWQRIALDLGIRWNLEEFLPDLRGVANSADAEDRALRLAQLAVVEARNVASTERNHYLIERFLGKHASKATEIVLRLLRSTLHIRAALPGKSSFAGVSYFGGYPPLASLEDWPKNQRGRAMEFFAVIHEEEWKKLIPEFEGHLLFFVDEGLHDGAVVHLLGGLPPALTTKPPYCCVNKRVQMEIEQCQSLSPWSMVQEPWRWRDLEACPELGNTLEASALLIALSGKAVPDDSRCVHTCFEAPSFTQNPHFDYDFEALGSDPPPAGERLISLLSVSTDDLAGIAFPDTGTMTFMVTAREFENRDFSRVQVSTDYC